jgi:hypothetical protein
MRLFIVDPYACSRDGDQRWHADGYSEMSVQFNLNRFATRVPKAPGLRCVYGLHCDWPSELFVSGIALHQ